MDLYKGLSVLFIGSLISFLVTTATLQNKTIHYNEIEVISKKKDVKPVPKINYLLLTKVLEEKEKRDIKCLAMNIYYEARNQSILGQHAVAHVTINRVKHERWPNSVCGVVYQKLQFSWTIKGKNYKPKDMYAWKRANLIAEDTLSGNFKEDLSNGALYYHADYVKPKWRKRLIRLAQIETHIFYK